jgi:hypothetical protein
MGIGRNDNRFGRPGWEKYRADDDAFQKKKSCVSGFCRKTGGAAGENSRLLSSRLPGTSVFRQQLTGTFLNSGFHY